MEDHGPSPLNGQASDAPAPVLSPLSEAAPYNPTLPTQDGPLCPPRLISGGSHPIYIPTIRSFFKIVFFLIGSYLVLKPKGFLCTLGGVEFRIRCYSDPVSFCFLWRTHRSSIIYYSPSWIEGPPLLVTCRVTAHFLLSVGLFLDCLSCVCGLLVRLCTGITRCALFLLDNSGRKWRRNERPLVTPGVKDCLSLCHFFLVCFCTFLYIQYRFEFLFFLNI